MLDFILGLAVAAAVVRGWVRGLVREALDLVGLIVGIWIALKLSAPVGDFFTERFGVTPEVARIAAGIALFIVFGVALGVAAHYLSKVMTLPGLNLANRLGGAAVGATWVIALLLVVVNVVRVMPIPESWRTGLEESTVVNAIAGPDAIPQTLFDALAPDNLLSAIAAIQGIFGESRAVPEGTEVLTFPPVPPDEVRQMRDEAGAVVEEVNRLRVAEDVGAALVSDALVRQSETRAVEMYTTGRLARSDDCLVRLEASSQLTMTLCQDYVALAGSSSGALDGILGSTDGSQVITEPGFTIIGVSVVDGPTGRLLVITLAG